MFQKELFKDKVVLVTGGGSGIGFAIAQQYLDLGATVYIASRKKERIDDALVQLQKHGDCRGIVADIRDIESVENVAKEIKEQSKRLDILINNAGGQFASPAEDISIKGWNAVVNNNLNGTWYMTQVMAKMFFLPQQSGNILNIVLNNFRGTPGMVHSAAARAGVENMTMTLAVEWAKKGVRINSVAPGIIQSSGLENYPPQLLEGISEKIPMKRLGSVEEVAYLVLFLTSPMATYITGETVYVDGGNRLWGDFFPI